MAGNEIYIAKAAVWLCKIVGEGASALAELDTDGLGLRLPEAITQDTAVQSAGTAASTAGQELATAAVSLESAVSAGDEGGMLESFIEIGRSIYAFYQALDDLVTVINSAISSATIPDGIDRTNAENFVLGLSKKLADYFIIIGLESTAPRIALLLKLIGLIEWERIQEDPAIPTSRSYVKRVLRFDRFKDLISDPVAHLQNSTRWGLNDFNPTEIFEIIASFLDEEDDFNLGVEGGEPYFERGNIRVLKDSSQSPPGLRVEFRAELSQSYDDRVAISDRWGVGIRTNLTLNGGVTAIVAPPLSFNILPAEGEVTGELRFFFNRNPEARPFILLGGTGLLNISLDDVSLGAGLIAEWDAIEGVATINPLIFSEISGATIRIGSTEGDSFIGNLLSNSDIEGQFDFGLEWQADTGLRIKASGGIEIALPIHKQLAIVEVETIYLALRILDSGDLALEVSADLTGNLGPLSATVSRLGAQIDLEFAEGVDADFGFFNLDLGFKWPTGVGLSLDAQGIKGGGFLEIDRPNHRYVGILQLEFQDTISLTAIGLITTELPGGREGFSLLILICAEFQPIQLGMGFTLNGIGGLLGYNRTMVIDVLREGVRDNSLKSILFPEDPVANAMEIISDLRAAFPPYEGQFVIGPMAKIGYGTPTLISLELGLVIEIPDPFRIAILGVLKAVLPEENTALIKIQVNFLGTIDFEVGKLTFDASLFDSRLLSFDLSGDMAVRLFWKEDPQFLLSVGGFHPAFEPPPLDLPKLRRIALQLLKGDNPRLRLETYMAVTSNTVQFGARLELYAGAGSFNVYGFLAFDVLFQFSPFYFIASIGAMLVLRSGSSTLAGISLSLSLEGPTPWKAKGTAKLKLFWFLTVKVRFSTTWGDRRDTLLEDVAVLDLVVAALQNKKNWQSMLPAQRNILVSVKEIAPLEDEVIVHPCNGLIVSQKIVPLNVRIDKFGNAKPSDFREFSISNHQAGGIPIESGDIQPFKDYFAPDHFFKKSDAKKLSADSYVKYNAGFSLVSSGQVESSHYVKREVEYELSYIDSQREELVPIPAGRLSPDGILFNLFTMNRAIARSPLSYATNRKSALAPDAIQVNQEGYAVANINDLSMAAGTSVMESEAEALDLMNKIQETNPALSGILQVIQAFEINEGGAA